MITRIHIQNYRSFVDAEVKLRPFSLVIGANGSGKTNFLRAFITCARSDWAVEKTTFIDKKGVEQVATSQRVPGPWTTHANQNSDIGVIEVERPGLPLFKYTRKEHQEDYRPAKGWLFGARQIEVFNLQPFFISGSEAVVPNPRVDGLGQGTAQVLEALKNGDREELFDEIESKFRQYVPEVEKLSLQTTEQGKKRIQVRERGLSKPLPATELSEGTRLILCILTIIHQEKPPPVILLEDIDRGMHPRIFEQVVPLMRDIAEKHDINIIATTHNPYLVDCFQDDKEAVIIVEKKDGASTLSTLASRLEGLDYDKIDPDDMPLGNLWYSGFVGGVPGRTSKRVKP